jgi:hypothetical protein
VAPRGQSSITQRPRRCDVDEGNVGAGLLLCQALQGVKFGVGQAIHTRPYTRNRAVGIPSVSHTCTGRIEMGFGHLDWAISRLNG